MRGGAILMALERPLPVGMRIVRATATPDGEVIFTVQFSAPEGVLSLFSEVLELAARMTGREKLGALLTAICAEAVSSWIGIEKGPGGRFPWKEA